MLSSLLSEIADCSRIPGVWFSEHAEVRIGHCVTDVFFNSCTSRAVRSHRFVISEVDISTSMFNERSQI